MVLSGVLYKLQLFKAFLQIPFLWEIRAILDWTVAHTSLELFSFLKLEDIYAGLCLVRADMLYRYGRDAWLNPVAGRLLC